jgi:hypothetical protein
MNDLSITRFFDLEHMATDPRDGRSDHDVTVALTHDHWATLSRFYAEHPAAFHAEADRSWGPRAERLRDKIASLS